MAGGLTLGAGALVGALVGALTFGGAAWGANKMFDQEKQSFQLSTDYLNGMVSQVLLKYLLISHFGRGRGRYTSPAAPQQWSEVVQKMVQSQTAQWLHLWAQAREAAQEPAEADALWLQAVRDLLQQSLTELMQQLYPALDVDWHGQSGESAP